jgi:hypothetical protein
MIKTTTLSEMWQPKPLADLVDKLSVKGEKTLSKANIAIPASSGITWQDFLGLSWIFQDEIVDD